MELLHSVYIRAKEKYHDEKAAIFLKWENMPYSMRIKWDWYFQYRLALIRVEHPKWQVVEIHFDSKELVPERDLNEYQLKARISALKAQVTKAQNQFDTIMSNFETLKANWHEMFPIEEHPKYDATMKAIIALEGKIQVKKEKLNMFLNLQK